jgi:hypothetical protein
MKHTKRFRLVARLVLMLSVLGAAGASAFSLWPDSLPPTNLYRVVAYLDRAPSGANIRDRIRIRAQGFPERELIVTDYQTPGETGLDLDLSRALGGRYGIMGSPEDVRRLFEIPPAQQLVAFVVAYQRPPSLYIADLDDDPSGRRKSG